MNSKNMTSGDVRKMIESKWENEKSQKFMTHIMYSYFPVSKSSLVWDNESKKELKCAITGVRVYSVSECLQIVHENQDLLMKNFKERALAVLDGKDPGEHPLVEKLGGKMMRCYTGTDTNTVIAEPVMRELVDWVGHRILMGDKRLNWLLKNMRNKAIANAVAPLAEGEEEKRVVKKIEHNAYRNKSAKISLGDIDVLKQLQEKLQRQEANS